MSDEIWVSGDEFDRVKENNEVFHIVTIRKPGIASKTYAEAFEQFCVKVSNKCQTLARVVEEMLGTRVDVYVVTRKHVSLQAIKATTNKGSKVVLGVKERVECGNTENYYLITRQVGEETRKQIHQLVKQTREDIMNSLEKFQKKWRVLRRR